MFVYSYSIRFIILNKIKVLLLVFLLMIMAIQLSPVGLEERYDKFRLIIITITGILFLFSFQLKNVLSIKIFRLWEIILVGEFFLLGLLFVVGGKVVWGPYIEFLMAFVFIVISFNMRLTKVQYIKILNVFIWSTLFVGLTCIYTYALGFVINDLYMPVPKNQIAPLLTAGCFVAFFSGNYSIVRWKQFYYWGIAFLLFLCICVFRARANIVAIVLGLVIYIVFYKRKISTLFVGCLLGIIVLILTPLGEFVYNAIFLNYDVSDLNSVSAGRTNTYMASLDFILNNFFLGESYGGEMRNQPSTVHNYVLYILEKYGFGGSFLLLWFYIRLLFEIGRNNVLGSKQGFFNIGNFVFIIPLVVSLFEYTYPYAPGSAVFMAYFCLGQYYRRISYKECHIF